MSTPTGDEIYKLGHVGDYGQIMHIQHLVGCQETGIYDLTTHGAITGFQTEHSLEPNGVTDIITVAYLHQSHNKKCGCL